MELFNSLTERILTEAKKDVNDLSDFISTRKKGAEKIQKAATSKGGPSKLTAIHFAAKEKPYSQALDLATKENCNKILKEKGNALARKILRWHTMSQREFQEVLGQLEAYGEVYIKLVKPDSVKF